MKVRTVFLLMVMLFPAPLSAADAEPGRTLLVHVKTCLDGGNDHTRLIPQVIAGALKKGYKAVLLFDGEGVLSLKMGRWFGCHSTPSTALISPGGSNSTWRVFWAPRPRASRTSTAACSISSKAGA
jgi:hypothetical protein